MIISDQNHGTMKLEPSDEVLKELYRLRAENEKLRAILFQFAAYDDDYENDDSGSMTVITVPIGVIRAAAAALKETE